MTIRSLAAAATLALAAACAPIDAAPVVPPASDEPCDTSSVQDLAGRPATQQLGADALARTGARTIHWIQPGMAVTMDYRADRLNIELDGANRVINLRCG